MTEKSEEVMCLKTASKKIWASRETLEAIRQKIGGVILPFREKVVDGR